MTSDGGGHRRLDLAAREMLLGTMLAYTPDAVVMAFSSAGVLAPVPEGVPVGHHRLIHGPGTALEVLPASQIPAAAAAWQRAQEIGADGADVWLDDYATQPARMHFIDMAERYGVTIAVLIGAAEAKPGQIELPIFRPRRCEVRKDALAMYTAVDSAFVRLLGWPADEVVGHQALEFIHPEDRERSVGNWMDMLAHPGAQCRVRLRHQHKDGSWSWVEITNTNRLGNPDHRDVHGELLDISDEMATQDALRASESLLRALTEALPLGVLHFAPNRKIRYRNERIKALLDGDRAETVDEQLASVHPGDRPAVGQALIAVLAGQDCDLEVRIRRARRCHLRLRPLTDDQGEVTGALLSVADITEDARLREELRQRATYDALTQCLNRAAIMDELGNALAAAPTGPSDGPGTAVIFFDVDHFKDINDRFGHGVGDQLLVAVARRLRATARTDDLVGRLGGDEFLVVCRKLSDADFALAVAERIADGLGEPLQLAHTTLHPKASIGVAWSSAERDPDALVDQADIAMYESKRERLGRPVLFRA